MWLMWYYYTFFFCVGWLFFGWILFRMGNTPYTSLGVFAWYKNKLAMTKKLAWELNNEPKNYTMGLPEQNASIYIYIYIATYLYGLHAALAWNMCLHQNSFIKHHYTYYSFHINCIKMHRWRRTSGLGIRQTYGIIFFSSSSWVPFSLIQFISSYVS